MTDRSASAAGAPPPGAAPDERACPWCDSPDVEKVGSYATLLMTEQWFCRSCASPFERIRHR